MGVPYTTHQWLRPLYDYLSGKGTGFTTLGSPTGVMGLYGATGAAPLPTGGLYVGGSAYNGGSGTAYTQGDIVIALKNLGVLKP